MDLADKFQQEWYINQVLLHGRKTAEFPRRSFKTLILETAERVMRKMLSQEGEEKNGRGETMMADQGGLHAVVLRLLPQSPVAIPMGLGRWIHAAFLSMMEEVDSKLAADLHRSGVAQRPFTISPLQGVKLLPEGGLKINPERMCSLRITFFSPLFYHRLTDHLARSQDVLSLRFGPAEFLITEMIGMPGSFHGTGCTTWDRLLEEAPSEEKVTLEFDSPTVFRQGDLDLPLPLPDLVFTSYLAKWQAFSPIPLEQALSDKEFFVHHVGVKEHHIRTVPFHDGRVIVPGFVGRVTFLIKGLPKDLVRQINTLADFSFYAGTGRKTTHGMGQTRRIS